MKQQMIHIVCLVLFLCGSLHTADMVNSMTLTIDVNSKDGRDGSLGSGDILTFVDGDTCIGMKSVNYGEELLLESLQLKGISPLTTVIIVPNSGSKYSVGIQETSLQRIDLTEDALSIRATMVKGKQVFLNIEESGVFPPIDDLDILIHNNEGVYLWTDTISLSESVDRDKVPLFLYSGFRYTIKKIIYTPYTPYDDPQHLSLVYKEINGSAVREGQTIRCGPEKFRYFEVLYDIPKELQNSFSGSDVYIEWRMKGKWVSHGALDGYKMPLAEGFGEVKSSDFRKVTLDHIHRQNGYTVRKFTVRINNDAVTMKIFIDHVAFKKIELGFEGFSQHEGPSLMEWKILSGKKEPMYKNVNLWVGRSGESYRLYVWDPYYVLTKKRVTVGDTDQRIQVEMKKSDAVRVALHRDGVDVGDLYGTRLYSLDSWGRKYSSYFLREKSHGDILVPVHDGRKMLVVFHSKDIAYPSFAQRRHVFEQNERIEVAGVVERVISVSGIETLNKEIGPDGCFIDQRLKGHSRVIIARTLVTGNGVYKFYIPQGVKQDEFHLHIFDQSFPIVDTGGAMHIDVSQLKVQSE